MPIYHVLYRFGRNYDDEIALYYLEKGALANAKGITDDALFFEACANASIEVLEKMLNCGADINEIGPNGGSGLLNAVRKKANIEKIRFLVENGANVNYYKTSFDSDANGNDNTTHPEKTILDIAEEGCSSDVVEYLKSMGAKHGNELEATE